MKRSILFRWLKILFVFYILVGVTLYFIQEKLLFHPESLPFEHEFHFKQPFREVNLPVNEVKNISIIQFTVPDSLRKGIVLYYHGNRRNVERYAPFASQFTRNGYEVWMSDYPGYGKTTGERTEKEMYADAEIVYKMAAAQIATGSIIVYGKSLGTGVATYVAFRKPCQRLILETPYYSIEALFNHYAFMYPVSWMSKFHFPNYKYMEGMEVPVHIFHGTRDRVIPYRQATLLSQKGKGAELITIDKGAHNDLASFPIFNQKLDSLLKL